MPFIINSTMHSWGMSILISCSHALMRTLGPCGVFGLACKVNTCNSVIIKAGHGGILIIKLTVSMEKSCLHPSFKSWCWALMNWFTLQYFVQGHLWQICQFSSCCVLVYWFYWKWLPHDPAKVTMDSDELQNCLATLRNWKRVAYFPASNHHV